MIFEEILDQAIAMLQRRGRLTYSTLKRHLQFDNAALNDVKHELIEGQGLAADERGNVLVWTGNTVSAEVGEHSGPSRRDVVWEPRRSVHVEQVVGIVPDHRVDVLFGDPTLKQRLREDVERLRRQRVVALARSAAAVITCMVSLFCAGQSGL